MISRDFFSYDHFHIEVDDVILMHFPTVVSLHVISCIQCWKKRREIFRFICLHSKDG